MSQDDEAAKELFEAKRQYHEAESMLAVATARLNRAETLCRAIWTKRINPPTFIRGAITDAYESGWRPDGFGGAPLR